MINNKNKLPYALFLVFITIFILIAIKGLVTPQPGDENVYYYMGRLISEGKIPYKDFFYAHPPLHAYINAVIYKIFGFNILILKLVPLLSTLASAFFIFKIAQKKFGNAEAVLSSLLFLFSYSIMFNSVFSFGINAAAMFLVIGAYFLLNKNYYIIAGLFFGFAGITKLLSLVPIAAILAITLFSSRKKFLMLSSGFLAVFLLVNGIFALFYGDSYITPVYKFHLLKSIASKENIKEYSDIIKLNWILFSSALLLVFARDKKKAALFAVISVAYLIFLTLLNKIFGFYFIIAFPFLAIIGGYSIVNIFRTLKLSRKYFIFVFAVILVIFAWNLASDMLFLEKIGFKGFERGKEIADFANSASGKGTMLFGDDSAVPLLALMTNKKIALHVVDTNNEVFISGVKNLSSILNDLKGKDVLFIIRSKQGISYFNEVKDFLNRNCELLSTFNDKIEGKYMVYKCV